MVSEAKACSSFTGKSRLFTILCRPLMFTMVCRMITFWLIFARIFKDPIWSYDKSNVWKKRKNYYFPITVLKQKYIEVKHSAVFLIKVLKSQNKSSSALNDHSCTCAGWVLGPLELLCLTRKLRDWAPSVMWLYRLTWVTGRSPVVINIQPTHAQGSSFSPWRICSGDQTIVILVNNSCLCV